MNITSVGTLNEILFYIIILLSKRFITKTLFKHSNSTVVNGSPLQHYCQAAKLMYHRLQTCQPLRYKQNNTLHYFVILFTFTHRNLTFEKCAIYNVNG